MTPTEVVQAFIEKINDHSVNGIDELMTEDHIFIDGGGAMIQGRKGMRDAWHGYFSMMPDYLITTDHILEVGNIVGVFGKASGTYTSDGQLKSENRWQVPAAWLAIVRKGKIAHWQVYTDSDSVSRIVAREEEKSKRL